MSSDQLEFAISQYLDGNLPPLEAAALEEQLATDAEARALLGEYRELDAALKASLPEPGVAWDRLHAHLSDAVSREAPPVVTYTMTAWRRVAAVAVAACALIAIGIAYVTQRGPSGGGAERTMVVEVSGPSVERADQAQRVAQVSIGPAPTMSESWRYAETVVSRPTVVLIDRASRPAQDIDASPF